MPALDEFLVAQAQDQVNLFRARETFFYEGGVKFSASQVGINLNGFYGILEHIVGQGAEVDAATGATHWVVKPSPDNRTYGAEVEASAIPARGLSFLGAATFLE